jgi:hypothetical protein
MNSTTEFEQACVYMEASILLVIKKVETRLCDGVLRPEIIIQVPNDPRLKLDPNSLQLKALKERIWETQSGFEAGDRDAYGTYGDWFVEAVSDTTFANLSMVRALWEEIDEDGSAEATFVVPKLQNWAEVVAPDVSVEEAVCIMEMFQVFYATDIMEWKEALQAASRLTK